MKITNRENVLWLNSLTVFIEKEQEQGKALLSAKGEYAIVKNRNAMLEAYKPYEETLKKFNQDKKAIDELLNLEVDVDIIKIGQSDFMDGVTSAMIMALEFMTE